MKKIRLIIAVLFYTFLFLPTLTDAQENQSAEWIRVQSDDGEFSIEVPAKYSFVVDKDGFSVADKSNNYALKEVRMLNAYREKTLFAFESYKAGKNALDSFIEQDKRNGKLSQIERGDLRVKQILLKTDKFYAVRQYFNSKNNIYILTAASRNGETPAMKRFFDSMIFKPSNSDKTANNSVSAAISFSALKISQIEFDEKPEPFKFDASKPQKPNTDENALPLQILFKPRPSYTDAARMSSERGTIQMRVTFSEDGFISKVGFLKTLKYGLLRQAFFAALRLKFLPREKDEKPQTVAKVIEYSFDIF